VPAPATVRLLGDAPIYSGAVQKELVTPTGALVATSYATSFGPIPPMSIERIGYGAGERDNPTTPNVLRVLIGRETALTGESTEVAQAFKPAGEGDRVTVIECEIDDMNPQIFGVVMDRLYAAGALEVFYIPVQMKKNRPGTLLTVVSPPHRRSQMADVIFRETTTIGLRHYDVDRECLQREIVTVETPIGAVRFKVARRDGRVVNAVPEFEDCVKVAAATNLPVKEVQAYRGQRLRSDASDGGVVSRFFISTPIYYINAEPHLGHAYTTMVADASARAHRLMGDDVFFLTGTDEHGQKVERAAQKAGLPVKAFADQVAQKFRDLLPTLNISNDDFIRTTEPRHYAACQALWRRVRDRGHIYKGKYEGWYCTIDEVFVPDTQLQDGRCPICGNTVERIAEESYFFRLSAFRDRLLEHYTAHHDFVTPQSAAQRDDVVPRSRTRRSEREPHVVHVGHSCAGRHGARDVRLVRRAHELHDRRGIRRRRRGIGGEIRALLAGGRASHRQGNRAPARDLLAGVPDGGRLAAAAPGRQPWLVADGGRQDVEVPRQRRAAAGVHRPVRSRRAPLFRVSRDGVRPGCQLHGRSVPHTLQLRPRE